MDNFEEQIKIERAKSFFVLAQVFVILAGFFFASAGISYSASFNSFDKAVEMNMQNNSGMNFSVNQKMVQVYGDLTIMNLNLFRIFLICGIIISVLSVCAWFVGNRFLK